MKEDNTLSESVLALYRIPRDFIKRVKYVKMDENACLSILFIEWAGVV
jgi:hypothetical protein